MRLTEAYLGGWARRHTAKIHEKGQAFIDNGFVLLQAVDLLESRSIRRKEHFDRL